ncbi:MAG TPA: VTT domain-containing protein [Blastocatellia bacterium]|nr:VTT domain-containing protein [Blastocatellia bacterium]
MDPTTTQTIEFLIRHGYVVLFVWVFAEQLGVPLPSTPLLLAAGALAGSGQINLALALGISVAAALLGDLIWYEFGRRRGGRVLTLLCKISLEPDSCVRKTETAFELRGARSLLIAKFVPGLNTMAPPLAGVIGMRLSRFVVFDALGALFYIGTFVGLGFVFSNQLEQVAARVASLGFSLVVLVVVAFAGYVLWKYIQRQRFIRSLRIARISPEELKKKIEAGEDVVVVDLRGSLDFQAAPRTIPGAIRLAAEQLDSDYDQIPRDREIILFCT